MFRRTVSALAALIISATFFVPQSSQGVVVAPRVPNAPIIGAVTSPVSQQLSIAFTLGSNNGSSITLTEYSIDGGTNWYVADSSPLVLKQLTNGIVYTIRMRSTNAVGVGAVALKTGVPQSAANVISFASPSPMTYGDSDQVLTVSSTAKNVSLAVTTPTICTLVNGAIRPLQAGNCIVSATSAKTDFYSAAVAVNRVIPIAKAIQAITFPSPLDMVATDANQAISASAPAGTVTLRSTTTSICTLVSGAIKVVTGGTCTITATNSGNLQYLAAVAVSRSITITKASQSITFPSPTDMWATDSNQSISALAPAGTVTLKSTTPLVCTLVSGAIKAVTGGTCTITATQAGNALYSAASTVTRSITITKTPQVISFKQPGNMLATDADQPLEVSAPGGTVTIGSLTPTICSLVSGSIRALTSGTCTILASQKGGLLYSAADPVSRTITITKAPQSISFPIPDVMFVGDQDQSFTATAVAGAVSVSVNTPLVCRIVTGAIRALKAGTCSLTATQSGTTKYLPAESLTRTFVIYPIQNGPWTIRQITFDDSNSTNYSNLAGDWVWNGWYKSGLGFRIASTFVGSTTDMTYRVTDGNNNPAVFKTVYFALGKVNGGSNAHVKVGTVVANGSVGSDGQTPVIISGVTNANGEVTFSVVNTDTVASNNLYTQVAAYVTSFTNDTIDITNIEFSQSNPNAPKITGANVSSGERGSSVTVTGTNLTNATFTIGGASATVASGATATSATLTIPNGASIGVGTIIATTNTGSATRSFEVLKTTVPIALTGLTASYTGSARSATAVTSPVGLNVLFTYNGSATAPTNVGIYSVTATISNATYRGTVSGSFTINKATATVALSNLSQMFDGTAKSATVVTSPTGKNVAVTYDGETAAPSAVGSYAVVAAIVDSNYTGSATGTLVISSASPSPSPTAVSYKCTLTTSQECGPLSALSVISAGTVRTVQNGAVTLSPGQDVTFVFESSYRDAGSHLQVHWYDMSAGLTSTVSYATLSSPWSTSLCYPDGVGTQCQIELDANGSATFTVQFSGNTAGKSFKYDMLANGYNSGYVTATFSGATPSPTATASASASASATPTASATASPTATPTPSSTSTGPWTIRQTTYTDANSINDQSSADGWVANGWFHSGLRYRVANVTVGSTNTIAYLVTDSNGQPAKNKSVFFALGKAYSGANASVKVGNVTAAGTVGADGVNPVIIPATTNNSGVVSFDIENLNNNPSATLYTQVTAYVTSMSIDTIDITTLVYSLGTPLPTPTATLGTLLWSDEFTGSNGAAPNASYWTPDIGDGCAAPNYNCGWGNSERQSYQSDANKLDGAGSLKITPRSASGSGLNCYYGACNYISGKLTSRGKVGFSYGYLEAKIKSPTGNGAWPAFWMLNNEIFTNPWPKSGEIDIFEVLDNTNSGSYTNWGTAHYADAGGGHTQGPSNNTIKPGFNLAADYHTYGILWMPDSITWYLDGAPYSTLRKTDNPTANWPFGPNNSNVAPKFYAILNVAMQNGASVGNPMMVDYVRYYSANGFGTVTLGP